VVSQKRFLKLIVRTFGRLPLPHEIASWADDPVLHITVEAIAALFTEAPSKQDLETFIAGFKPGSVSGLVNLFIAIYSVLDDALPDLRHRILAHLADLVLSIEGADKALLEAALADLRIQKVDVEALRHPAD